MSATNALPQSPQADLEMDLRTMRIWLALDEDGEPELVMRCDEGTREMQTVVIGHGMGGHWQAAIAAAEAAVTGFQDLADDLRRLQRKLAAEGDGERR